MADAFFSEESFAFLDELAANNRREWFQENRGRYEALIREPALAFVRAMRPRLEAIAPHFRADDRKLGGSLMRIHRDVRFSRDKSPYKTNIGIQFRHEHGRDVHAPGYYLHISPSECFVGVGTWRPPSASLAKIRRRIAERPAEWRQVRDDKDFGRWFHLGGESLKRPPRGFDAQHPMIEDLKRKDFIGMAFLPNELVTQPDLDGLVADYFSAAAPFMRFLCQAVGVSF